jgi:hypothetical protein
MMKILFVADGRSPTTLSWLQHWLKTNHQLHLVSTFPCARPAGLDSFHILPVAFSRMAGGQVKGSSHQAQKPSRAGILRDQLRKMRYYAGPISLPFHWVQFQNIVVGIQPDLVHALRIPYEGMLASCLGPATPLVISTWGNDITLHARGSFLMSRLTRTVFKRANGLISDTQRDIRLAREWGFSADKPVLSVPGSGGVHLDQSSSSEGWEGFPEELPDAPIVVNPRGQRPGSLRQDVFFQAIPLVAQEIPQALFVCPSLRGEIEFEGWVAQLGIQSNTRLWPRLTQAQLWNLFRKSQVFVSPSLHDGTSNALLESMACGCFPVVGDIESMREWVKDGVNGYLVDATRAQSIADAITRAIKQPALRRAAAKYNAALIAERAEYEANMLRVEKFYEEIILKR